MNDGIKVILILLTYTFYHLVNHFQCYLFLGIFLCEFIYSYVGSKIMIKVIG
jgi:hypothetical protein